MAKSPRKPSASSRSVPSAASPASPGKRARRTPTRKAKSTRVRAKPSPIPVVGLGGSAGGLQAFTDFFKAMPDSSGMAFVVIHHVDPDHESLMADLLAKHTKMKVALAVDETKIKPNNVYIIPPNQFLSIRDSVLYLTEPAERRGMRLPIDFFLRSLAHDQKKSAIAIVLSGSGSDGAVGIRSIKEWGGMVLVQDPKEAMHDGMPRSAIATESVDLVLPVAKMPAVIADYANHSYMVKKQTTATPGARDRESLADIISALKVHSPINFEFYKEGTLLRRIERRMALRHMENPVDYQALLSDSPEEAEKLCADLLISVTAFFRDPDTFDYLEKTVIHDMVANSAAGQPIRIWVPACATGEEAYSLAILFIEVISETRKNVKLQVFASDVDDRAIDIARVGVYPDAIAADVSPDRLSRFFVREDHSYRVNPELRDALVFANQDILADAPFSKLDLISCRNLLIYLNSEVQERIIQMFHFALKDDGVLLLGSSETANSHEEFFQPLSKKHRLYKRVGKARHRQFDLPVARRPSLGLSPPALRIPGGNHGLHLAEISQKLLIERYTPAAVLVNARMESLFVQGPADQFLKVPVGEASQDLLAMAREGLRSKLASVIRNALKSGQDSTARGTVTRDRCRVPVKISAHPLVVDEINLVLVTFIDQPPDTGIPTVDVVSGDSAQQNQLEQELEVTRLELQNTITDFERSTEELKASNEEAMSMNEEFQSTNEELETSKEELQSLNEELTTLNTQLQQKVEDERRLSDDLNNLLFSSGIATLFLDRQLNIMRFTPATRELFNVIANDVGRPFSDITGKIEDANLLRDALQVLQDLVPIEIEVQTRDEKWFIRRILPYRTQDGKIDGVVVTFADVTELKTLQQQGKEAQRFAESIVDTVRNPMLVLNEKFKIIKASTSYLEMFQVVPEDVEGKTLYEVQGAQWDQPELRKLVGNILPEQASFEAHEMSIALAERGERTVLVNARPIQEAKSSSHLILLAAEDVTESRLTKQELVEREARLSAILNAAPEAIITIDEHGIIGSFSPAAVTILGYEADEVIGQDVSILMPEPHCDQHDEYLAHYLRTGEKKIIGTGREMSARCKDGSQVPIRLTVSEFWIQGVRYFTGILLDLSDDMKRRSALQRAQKMEAVGQLTGGLAHDFNNLLTVIIGNLELLELQLSDFPELELLDEAREAANLGAKLTTQLLSFSRKQALDPEKVPLNELVNSIKPLLVRTLGERITVKTDLAADLNSTLTDPGQIENAILNLAINARDAMPTGGTLTITTRNVVLDEDYAATQLDVEPGDYVALSVTDTGIGMRPDVVERVFEPFFTTKVVGAGSGLGLSMIYGFAKQSGGHVAIYSEEGVGTTVTLYLHPCSGSEVSGNEAVAYETPQARNETILVVEDDPHVRKLTVTRLGQLGYSVLEAQDGPMAIQMLKTTAGIDLVLSDIVMPGGMSGFQVVDQALEINPLLKVLLTTGYASGGDKRKGEARTEHHILRKPYSLRELARTLRDLLE